MTRLLMTQWMLLTLAVCLSRCIAAIPIIAAGVTCAMTSTPVQTLRCSCLKTLARGNSKASKRQSACTR